MIQGVNSGRTLHGIITYTRRCGPIISANAAGGCVLPCWAMQNNVKPDRVMRRSCNRETNTAPGMTESRFCSAKGGRAHDDDSILGFQFGRPPHYNANNTEGIVRQPPLPLIAPDRDSSLLNNFKDLSIYRN